MAETLNPRMKALQNLSAQLPIANQQVANGQAAARDLQLQNAVKAAPAGTNTTQTAQQTGAASAQTAGQAMLQQADTQVKQQGQIGQLAIGAQQQQAQSDIAGLKSGARENESTNVQKLASISEAAKKELYDDQMSFAKDSQGRTLFNERQLADYAKSSAKSDEEYANMQQSARQISDRKTQIMEHSFKLVTQDLENKIRLAEQAKDQKLQMELAEMKRAANEAMARQKSKANNTSAMFQAGGTVVGAVAGGVAGSMIPGAGTVAGASLGASLGSSAGGMAAAEANK